MGPKLDYIPLNSPFDLLKQYCEVCRQHYWFKHNCPASPQEKSAHAYVMQRQQEIANGDKRHGVPKSGGGLTTVPCPDCNGESGHTFCHFCDGSGFVPSNMF